MRDDKTVADRRIDDHAKEQELVPVIEALLKESGSTYKTLNRIAAIIGPGGFMSLRVGLSLANTLAWSLRIPIAGMHLSDLWFARLSTSPPSPLPDIRERGGPKGRGEVVWLHSTKKTALFLRKSPEEETILLTLDEAVKEITKGSHYVGELLEEQEKFLEAQKTQKIKSVGGVLPALVDRLEFRNTSLIPWYGRGA